MPIGLDIQHQTETDEAGLLDYKRSNISAPRIRACAHTNAAVGMTAPPTPPLILLIYAQWQIWLLSLGRVALMHQRGVHGWVAVGAALGRYPSNPYVARLCI